MRNVGIGIDKSMNIGIALFLNASEDTGARPDDGTGLGTDLDTSANSLSATDCQSGKSAGRQN